MLALMLTLALRVTREEKSRWSFTAIPNQLITECTVLVFENKFCKLSKLKLKLKLL